MALALVLFALALPTASDTTGVRPPDDPARQVITRQDIEAAGLYRVPDLFRLLDGTRTATVDGFTWRAGLLDGDPFGAEAWALLLDGARVDLGLFGRQNLSLLPVAITQIDSVEVWTEPRLVGGRLAAGVVHVHTRQARAGPAARAGAAIGNEVGDPGPFRYVPELRSRNVDKIGGNYDAWAGAGDARRGASLRAKWLRFYPTDDALARRVFDALNGADIPRQRLLAPALRLDADVLGGQHRLQLLGAGLNDLAFFEPFGRELPVQRLYGQVALGGTLRTDSVRTLTYRLSAAENRWEKRFPDVALGPDPAWRGRTFRAGFETTSPLGPFVSTGGVEVERITARGAEGAMLHRLYGALARAAGRGAQRLAWSLTFRGGSGVGSVVLSARKRVRTPLGPATVAGTAGLVQRLPVETGRFSVWEARGYDAFDGAVAVERGGAYREATTGHLGLDAALALGPGVTVTAGGALRHFRGLALEFRPEAPDPDRLRPPPPLVVAPDARGSVATGRMAVRAARGMWRGRLSYDVQAPLAGDADFERAWAVVSRHRASAWASLTPAPSFTAWASLTARSGARWPAYAGLTGRGPLGLYDAEVPAAWLLDAALEKTVWQRRLRASLLFRNLLNAEERYHPVGAAIDLRMYLRVELQLGG